MIENIILLFWKLYFYKDFFVQFGLKHTNKHDLIGLVNNL